MSWTSNDKSNYISVVYAKGEYDPKEKVVTSFMITKGTDKLLKTLIDKFLEEMENEDLVKIEINEGRSTYDSEIRYGGRRSAPTFYVEIRVLKEDFELIDSDSSIRMKFITNVYSAENQKPDFIKFFKKFSKILG